MKKLKIALLTSALACTFALSTPMLVGCGDDQKVKDLESQVTTLTNEKNALTEEVKHNDILNVFNLFLNTVSITRVGEYVEESSYYQQTPGLIFSEGKYKVESEEIFEGLTKVITLKKPVLGAVYKYTMSSIFECKVKFLFENNKYNFYCLLDASRDEIGKKYLVMSEFTFNEGRFVSIKHYEEADDSDHFNVYSNSSWQEPISLTQEEKDQILAKKTELKEATPTASLDKYS